MGVQRGLQRALGLGPVPGREQHVGVDRAAGAEQRGGAVGAGELLDELAPLGAPLPLAGRRAALDEVAVRLGQRVHVGTRPEDAAAIASSSSSSPSSRRPEVTTARPSRLSANTSRSTAPVARPIRIARRASVICSCRRVACRARSTATQPRPGQVACRPSSVRSARASQPRAADARPASRVLVRHPHGDARGLVAAAGGDVALEGALAARRGACGTWPRNHSASPSPSCASGASAGVEHRLEGPPGAVPVRRLQRGDRDRQRGGVPADGHGQEHRGSERARQGPLRRPTAWCRRRAGTPSRTGPRRPSRRSTCRRTGRGPRRTPPRARPSRRSRARRSSGRSRP